MDIFVAVSILLPLVILLYFGLQLKYRGLPPGPAGIPFIGNVFVVNSKNVCKNFADVGKKYGGFFTVKVFMKPIVVINDWASMKEALVEKTAIFSARPRFFVVDYTMKHSDIASASGPTWKEKRRFTMHHLKNLGFGKSSMESHIQHEALRAMKMMDTHEGGEIEMCEMFHMPVLNVLWGVISGKAYEYDDDRIKEFLKIAVANFDVLAKAMPINFLPFLRFLPFDLFGFKQSLVDFENTQAYYNTAVDEHQSTFQENDLRDFIDTFLSKIKLNQTKNGPLKEDPCYTKRHLVGILDNLLIAGVETTSSTLEWAFLYMAVWPEIQSRIQKELDDVIGRHRLPSMQDLPMLTYTEATIMEVQRMASVLPVMFHAPIATTTVKGYTIPKDTWVFRNIWAVHHDENLWGDPEVFRPERFINADGKLEKPEYFIPFSTGCRFCLGEPLARMSVFLFFTCILQKYTFCCTTGKPPPSLILTHAVTLKPKPFSLTIHRR